MTVQMTPTDRTDIEDQLTALLDAPIAKLRDRYREVFHRDPPPAFGSDLLRRSIAYEIQERTYGGLKTEIRRELERLVRTLGKNPAAKIELPRGIKPGSMLVRQWKGKSHSVTVSENGFVYEGEPYPTLSEIAREITGTRWNGPRFFGLRKASENKNQKDKTSLAAGALPS
jgi:hypothetical protein